MSLIVNRVEVRDIRFPTSLENHGSDAVHTEPDYSCVYVTLHIENSELKGYGLTFTLGRGNEIVAKAANSLAYLVEGECCMHIWNNFADFYRKLTNDPQLRWIGPEKGAVHLAAAAILNALWDAWARHEEKPLWKLLADMEPEKLVSTIDFKYLLDVITPKDCIEMLNNATKEKSEREETLRAKGFPAYVTSMGWLGYDDEKISKMCTEYLQQGFTSFKLKVGSNLQDDKRRCKLVRDLIGNSNNLMIDANQNWEVSQAIEWVKNLAEFKPLWIEEPTSPDDIIGHAIIAKVLQPLKIGVATGEMCQNRVVFKQLFQSKSLSFCQIDTARVGGINENLAIYFMAKKFGVPVCPHAGGVGLCEMAQHLQMWDFVSLSGTSENRMIEWVDHLHEHFTCPPSIQNAHYMAPDAPGYSTEMKEDSLANYEYPKGTYWTQNPDSIMVSQ